MSARKRPGEPGLVVDPTHLPLILVGLPGADKTTVARIVDVPRLPSRPPSC